MDRGRRNFLPRASWASASTFLRAGFGPSSARDEFPARGWESTCGSNWAMSNEHWPNGGVKGRNGGRVRPRAGVDVLAHITVVMFVGR